MTFLREMDVRTGFLSFDDVKARGLELREQYNGAQPFPHIAIEDFLPEDILRKCLAEFPNTLSSQGREFDRSQERYKSSFHPDDLSDGVRTLFYAFNSRPFIRVLENITGIQGLIPDPYFLGAGFHEIREGGHLSVHADFNHHKPMNLERRINVLIYMNENWLPDYGGQLELWSKDMKEKAHSFDPTFNRCVIFNTNTDSYHGNPELVRHPDGISRKSIALYYYTSTWDASKRDHTTQFKVRSGTTDRIDWKVGAREFAMDLIPPVLARALKGRKQPR